MTSVSPIGSRETVAEGLSSLSEEKQGWLKLLMDNPAQDDLSVGFEKGSTISIPC